MPAPSLQLAFGHNMRRHRRRLRLSQEAFAELLGVHRTYVGGLERGERNLTLKTVERLCESIGADPLEMLRRVD